MKNEKYQEKSYRRIAFTLNKAYLKKFLKKDFFLLYSFIWPNINVWLPLLCEILGNMYIVAVC